MTDDKWSQARQKLGAEREETLAEVARLKEALKCELEYDMEEGDPDLYEREKLLALLRTQEEKRDSIDYALRLIDEGTYGTCEHCGREISSERLDALPRTTLCIECKALKEKGVTVRRAGQSAF